MFLRILIFSVPGNRATLTHLLDGWEDRSKPREHLHIHKDHVGAFVSSHIPATEKQAYFCVDLETWALSARVAGGQTCQLAEAWRAGRSWEGRSWKTSFSNVKGQSQLSHSGWEDISWCRWWRLRTQSLPNLTKSVFTDSFLVYAMQVPNQL